CDVDYDEAAEAWMEQLLGKLAQPVAPATSAGATTEAKPRQAARYDRKHPYPAELLDRVCLNGRGSSKQVYHVELSLEESGLQYQPGDSVGVYVQNNERLTEQLMSTLNLTGSETVDISGHRQPLA